MEASILKQCVSGNRGQSPKHLKRFWFFKMFWICEEVRYTKGVHQNSGFYNFNKNDRKGVSWMYLSSKSLVRWGFLSILFRSSSLNNTTWKINKKTTIKVMKQEKNDGCTLSVTDVARRLADMQRYRSKIFVMLLSRSFLKISSCL